MTAGPGRTRLELAAGAFGQRLRRHTTAARADAPYRLSTRSARSVFQRLGPADSSANHMRPA